MQDEQRIQSNDGSLVSISSIKKRLTRANNSIEKGAFKAALKILYDIITLTRADLTNESKLLLADALCSMSQCTYNMHDYNKALECAKEALLIYESLPYSDDAFMAKIAWAHQHVGDAFSLSGNIDIAVEHYSKELTIARNLYTNDKLHASLLIHALNCMGARLADQHKYDEALSNIRDSISIMGVPYKGSAAGRLANLSWTRHLMGHVLFKMNDNKAALSDLQAAFKMREQLSIKNKRYLPSLKNTLLLIGDIYARQMQKEQALIMYNQALGIICSAYYKKQILTSTSERKSLEEKIKIIKTS